MEGVRLFRRLTGTAWVLETLNGINSERDEFASLACVIGIGVKTSS